MSRFEEWSEAHPALYALLILFCGTLGGSSVGLIGYKLCVYVLEAL